MRSLISAAAISAATNNPQMTVVSKPVPGRVIRIPKVMELTGSSRAWVWRAVKEIPDFPQPFKLSEGVTVWSEAEVLDWLESRMATRNAAKGVGDLS